jgi:putative oxidoreductase
MSAKDLHDLDLRRGGVARDCGVNGKSASVHDCHSADSIQTAHPMKIATIIIRSLLGLMFVVFGLNMFLHFIPMPEFHTPPTLGEQFSGALMLSGYMYAIGALQFIGGLLLLIGRFVPLGLTLLGPVIVNIALFHIFLDRAGLPMAGIVSAMVLFLLYSYRSAFAGLVRP